jgi:UDP-N-acetylmuramyl pentapeptide phosphotransferase/UDP-N-acetylglucosamine-1-phosphate transferase
MTPISPLSAAVWLVTAIPIAGLMTWIVLNVARRRNFVDRPNERSSHREPRALGGGWAVVLTVLPLWIAAGFVTGRPPQLLPLSGAVLLVLVSWLDDLRNLSPVPRFAAHMAAVALGLAALPHDALVFQGLLPFWADRIVAGIGWVWFVNLYNFMDGIDGITGIETASIAVGLVLVTLLAGTDGTLPLQAAVLGGAMLGFLIWNWQPARIFLGDVGSVPVGFLTGGLLLTAATEGLWAPALILPAYHLADATVTLLRRAFRGEKVWQAHREHFYQRAVQAGLPHAAVSLRILALNVALVLLAVAAALCPPPAVPVVLALAAFATAFLLHRLAHVRPDLPAGTGRRP